MALYITGWLCIVQVPLSFFDVGQCYFRCLIVANIGGFLWSLLSHYPSLVFPYVFPGVLQLLTVVVFYHLRCMIATQWGALVSLQIFHCWLVELFCVITNIKLAFIMVVSCHPRCFTAAFRGCSASFQVTHFHSLRLLCVTPVLWPLTTGFAKHFPRY